jgi:hypothetical protein
LLAALSASSAWARSKLATSGYDPECGEMGIRFTHQTPRCCGFAVISLGHWLTPFTTSDIAVIVYYRPAYTFWHKKRALHFVTAPQADGSLKYYPQSSEGILEDFEKHEIQQ